MSESKKAILNKLQSLINIGPSIADKLYLIGIRSPEEVMNAEPEELYQRLQKKLGCHVDRCVLYVFRGARTGRPWPECSDNPKSKKSSTESEREE